MYLAAAHRKTLLSRLYAQRYLFVLLVPGLIYYAIFRYGPMYGMLIAFKKFELSQGIIGSPWVGLKYFTQFIEGPFFWRLVRNTLLLSLYQLVFGFPFPIVFSLLLNEVSNPHFKKAVQSISYLPHFISVVIVVGLMKQLVSPTSGLVNQLIESVGGEPINFFMEKGWFRPLYVISGVWQNFGWGAILYLAALSNLDPQLYEAARIDGAGRFSCILHITLPGIAPTIIIVLLLRMGQILNIGFEKVLLMYNPHTYETADIISTYVYRTGIIQANYSFATSVGLLNAVVTVAVIVAFNSLSRRVSEISLW